MTDEVVFVNEDRAAMERDGDDLFLIFDGVRIAKRGRPGTRHAKTWIPLEPGWTARDLVSGDQTGIEIERNGVKVH